MLARRSGEGRPSSIALEVLRRMKAMVRDDSILMAGVTGPFDPPARLMQMDASGDGARGVPESALEVAFAMVTRISGRPRRSWRQRDHDEEEVLPVLSQELAPHGPAASSPHSTSYDSMDVPVLQLTDACLSRRTPR